MPSSSGTEVGCKQCLGLLGKGQANCSTNYNSCPSSRTEFGYELNMNNFFLHTRATTVMVLPKNILKGQERL